MFEKNCFVDYTPTEQLVVTNMFFQQIKSYFELESLNCVILLRKQ